MGFNLAQTQDGAVPRHIERPVAAAQTYLRGALLLIDANGALAECGADPVAIAAVSESGEGSDTTGFNILGKKGWPPGRATAIGIKGQVFDAPYVGTLPAADGGSYGVVRDTDSEWKVDFTDTTATRVKLVGRRTTSPENIPRVLVKFLDANVQDF